MLEWLNRPLTQAVLTRVMSGNNLFQGFVLAGGKSSRMKTDKANLKFGGETFLERAVQTLAPICDGNVKIVLNQNQIAPTNYKCVRDVFKRRGAVGGIHAALRNCQSDWAIILACDLPFVTGAAIEFLRQTAASSNEFSAIVPKQPDGKLQPLCAVYRVSDCLPVGEKLLRETDSVSMRDFLELIPTRIVEFDQSTNENLFFNVNHQSDYEIISKR